LSPNGCSIHLLFRTFVMPNYIEWNANPLNAIPARERGTPSWNVTLKSITNLVEAFFKPIDDLVDRFMIPNDVS
jgi:hypothetical protein